MYSKKPHAGLNNQKKLFWKFVKVVMWGAESCNQQETEAEQVICNKNVRGIRGSTARSLCSENMPKNSRARIFCLQLCLKITVDFLPQYALLREDVPILMLQLSSPVLAYLLHILEVTKHCLSFLSRRTNIYVVCESVCGPGLKETKHGPVPKATHVNRKISIYVCVL